MLSMRNCYLCKSPKQVHKYMHVHIRTCIHTYLYKHILIHTHTHIHTYTRTYTCLFINLKTHTCIEIGNLSEEVCQIESCLATISLLKGDYSEAYSRFEALCAKRTSIYGRIHTLVAETLRDMGFILDRWGRWTEGASCIHTYAHTYIHTYIHTYAHTYAHTYIHTYMHTYVHV